MPRHRTFLGIDVGDEIRSQLVALQDELTAVAGDVKWVEPENLHITLLFLGEVEQRETADICRAAQKSIQGMPAFNITIAGAGAFPNLRRPRTLWVGVGVGVKEIGAVHDAIEEALMQMGSYRRETRGYVPHVTLGRVRGEGNRDELAKALAARKGWSAGEVMVTNVQVMTSELSSEGPT